VKNRKFDVHKPVLVDEVLESLAPEGGGVYVDLTLGAGGHAEAILERSSPNGILLGLDQDPEILEIAKENLSSFGERVTIEQGNFTDAARIFSDHEGAIHGALLDLGLSSLQLDRPERGFSIKKDGPLDMRMNPDSAVTAEEFVNKASREELMHAVGVLGEEPRARAVVEAILDERQKRPLFRTSDLRELIEGVYKRRSGKIHPATRAFQGLRMQINREIESLGEGLEAALRLLRRGGRLAVVSFHSGEDRVVKEFFKARKSAGELSIVGGGIIRPTQAEVRRNRRSRSARLRVAIRGSEDRSERSEDRSERSEDRSERRSKRTR